MPASSSAAAVDPGAVTVAVGEEDRPVGDDRVEGLTRRGAAREVLHRPAAADDPLEVGVRRGVRRDDGERLLGRRRRRAGRTGA